MIDKYVSIKTLIAKVHRDLDIQEPDKWVSMIEWSAEALGLIGAFSQYIPKTVVLDTTGFKAKLPCDFYKVQQIAVGALPIQYGTGTFDAQYHCSDCPNLKTTSQLVYTINDSFIFTNFEQDLCLSYLAIPTDEEGYPLIPDNVSYMEALYKYIDMKMAWPEARSGKLPMSIYREIVEDWNYKCMQARGNASMPNLEQLEGLKNQWMRLIPDVNRFGKFFNDLNFPEKIRLAR